MRFIHLADVHLGAVPDRGCPWSKEREEEIWSTFRRVIAGIREDPVDLLFISGDPHTYGAADRYALHDGLFYGRFCKWRGYSSHLRGTDGTD